MCFIPSFDSALVFKDEHESTVQLPCLHIHMFNKKRIECPQNLSPQQKRRHFDSTKSSIRTPNLRFGVETRTFGSVSRPEAAGSTATGQGQFDTRPNLPSLGHQLTEGNNSQGITSNTGNVINNSATTSPESPPPSPPTTSTIQTIERDDNEGISSSDSDPLHQLEVFLLSNNNDFLGDDNREEEEETISEEEVKLAADKYLQNYLNRSWLHVDWEINESQTLESWCQVILGYKVTPSFTKGIVNQVMTTTLDQWKELDRLRETDLPQEIHSLIRRLNSAFKKGKKNINDLKKKAVSAENWTTHGVAQLVRGIKDIKSQVDRLIPSKSEHYDSLLNTLHKDIAVDIINKRNEDIESKRVDEEVMRLSLPIFQELFSFIEGKVNRDALFNMTISHLEALTFLQEFQRVNKTQITAPVTAPNRPTESSGEVTTSTAPNSTILEQVVTNNLNLEQLEERLIQRLFSAFSVFQQQQSQPEQQHQSRTSNQPPERQYPTKERATKSNRRRKPTTSATTPPTHGQHRPRSVSFSDQSATIERHPVPDDTSNQQQTRRKKRNTNPRQQDNMSRSNEDRHPASRRVLSSNSADGRRSSSSANRHSPGNRPERQRYQRTKRNDDRASAQLPTHSANGNQRKTRNFFRRRPNNSLPG